MTAQNVISARTTPLSQLWLEAPHWTNPREFTGLDDDDIGELGASIKEKGIIEPLKVARIIVNGDIVDLVVDGQRRVLGAKEVLSKNAPIPVVDLIDEPITLTPELADELMIKAFTTLEREGLSSFELANAAKRWKARNKTGEWIAKVIHKSPSWVSKILKACETASPKLMLSWKKGDVTDEQFKELAEVKDPEKQQEAAKGVVDARKSGDKAEARVLAKETKERERVTNGHNTKGKSGKAAPVKPAVAGGQLTFDGKEEKPAPRRIAPNRLVLEDMIAAADKRPPTSDYVKGLMDGVRYATGVMEPKDFGKAWNQYLSRIEGRPRPAKKVKVAKAAKTAKVKKPAKAKKAAKKAKVAKKGRR